MNKEDRFIDNIHSKHQDRISVDVVYRELAEEANHECGLYYDIYISRFIGLLRHHLSLLNEKNADELRRYVESQGTKVDDKTYRKALKAERECRAEIAREQM